MVEPINIKANMMIRPISGVVSDDNNHCRPKIAPIEQKIADTIPIALNNGLMT
jgi:hypothetical protein